MERNLDLFIYRLQYNIRKDRFFMNRRRKKLSYISVCIDCFIMSQNSLKILIQVIFISRGVRNDASLVPPIRQTASIFKQPVTIYKTQEGKVKDIKHGNQEKPKQVRSKFSLTYLWQ